MNKVQLKQLLDSLTLKQKVGQMTQIARFFFGDAGMITGETNVHGFIPDDLKDAGSVLNVFPRERIKEIQEAHLKHNPVPLIFMADVIHGFDTIVPISTALGCTFEPELVKELAKATAKEAAADGINVTFSPMVDLVRDARWGRNQESYSEDVYLNCLMSRAMVEGYQGDDLSAPDTIAACVKHFAAYGNCEAGRDYNGSQLSERMLREQYLPAYKAAVDAGVSMVMSSYHTVNEIPCSHDKHLLKDILRDEWGFDGVLITDYGTLKSISRHGAANDYVQSAELAINATTDIDMMDNVYCSYLPIALEQGRVTMQQIDDAVMRILKLKNDLGLLDDPYKYCSGEKPEIDYTETHKKAYEATVKSCVLLKNEEKALPLDRTKKIAFIGPFVDSLKVNFALWSLGMPHRNEGITLKEAIEKNYSGDFSFIHGCAAIRKEDYFENDYFEDDCYVEHEDEYIAKAAEQAKDADVVVMCIGEPNCLSCEGRSRANIDIQEVQMKLFCAVSAVNSNIVSVVYAGRPLDLVEVSKKSKAVLFAWLTSSFGGEAVSALLFGDETPSGKLSMTMPWCVGQCPIYYNALPTPKEFARPCDFYSSHYMDAPTHPLYVFGHGLSYTSFDYSDITLSSDKLSKDGKITASVTVTNTGDREGDETVQLYIHDIATTLISRPVKELKAFKKITVAPGESKTVSFDIDESMLRFYNIDMEYTSEPGEFDLFIGTSSSENKRTKFTLI
jgi:beta-glucosidase